MPMSTWPIGEGAYFKLGAIRDSNYKTHVVKQTKYKCLHSMHNDMVVNKIVIGLTEDKQL